MTALEAFEGINKTDGKKLKAAGVTSVENLLAQGATKKGRTQLETETGINGDKLMSWINRADLLRVKGVGAQAVELLEAAGVMTLADLRKSKAAKLHETIVETNSKKKKKAKQVPSLKQVEGWVEQAKALDRVVK